MDEFELACKTLKLPSDGTSLTVAKIKKAYRKLALTVHPDRTHTEITNQGFIKLKNAYEYLVKDAQLKTDSSTG